MWPHNGHCGSKLSIAHEFSYETSPGVPAYGATSGVGFEDDVMFIAEEGHPLAGWGDGDAITGTVQVLDVRKGELYQLPHLSVGVIEMAFTVSTGHPDYIAVGIEEYGISGEKDGVQGGSRWNLWIGKKNKASNNFLERNGLAPNSGRVYVFVADSGEEDSEQRPCTQENPFPLTHIALSLLTTWCVPIALAQWLLSSSGLSLGSRTTPSQASQASSSRSMACGMATTRSGPPPS